MNFGQVKGITLPQGSVSRLLEGENVLWGETKAASDPYSEYSANIVARLTFDADATTDQVSGNTWLSQGNAVMENRALRLEALGDFIETENTIDLGGQDFTISAWTYLMKNDRHITIISGTKAKYRSWQSVTDDFSMELQYITEDTTCLDVAPYADGRFRGSESQGFARSEAYEIINGWHHVAVTYQHALLKLMGFLDGKKVCESSVTLPRSSYYWLVGAMDNTRSDTYYYNGYIDDVIILDGAAVWTEDFTPPERSA